MSTKIAIHEGARALPVGAAWAAMLGADPATQVSLVVGVLTCVYLAAQLWLILCKLRSEKRKLAMLEREHQNSLDLHEAEMVRARGDERCEP